MECRGGISRLDDDPAAGREISGDPLFHFRRERSAQPNDGGCLGDFGTSKEVIARYRGLAVADTRVAERAQPQVFRQGQVLGKSAAVELGEFPTIEPDPDGDAFFQFVRAPTRFCPARRHAFPRFGLGWLRLDDLGGFKADKFGIVWRRFDREQLIRHLVMPAASRFLGSWLRR